MEEIMKMLEEARNPPPSSTTIMDLGWETEEGGKAELEEEEEDEWETEEDGEAEVEEDEEDDEEDEYE